MELVTRESIGAQLRDSMIGWSRDVKPVPKEGKVRLDDIGNLSVIEHSGAVNVDLSGERFQQMIGNIEPVKPIGADAWRGALYGMGIKFNEGNDQPPPEPDAWMVSYEDEPATTLTKVNFDEGEQAIYMQTETNNYISTRTRCIYYVGRLAEGTKLKCEVEIKAANTYWFGEPVSCKFLGWRNGWFSGNDYWEYKVFSRDNRDGANVWAKYEEEIEIRPEYQDFWIMCEARSNSAIDQGGSINKGWFKGIKVSLA